MGKIQRYFDIVAEDWKFGPFNRSEAAKKGWETRKKNGWNPKVGLAESGGKVPTWAGKVEASGSGVDSPDGPRRSPSELSELTAARREYEDSASPESHKKLVDASRHIWDDRGRRNYFE